MTAAEITALATGIAGVLAAAAKLALALRARR